MNTMDEDEKIVRRQQRSEQSFGTVEYSVVLQLAATSHFWLVVSSDYLVRMCQRTVSKLTSHELKEMETKLCPQFIRFAPEYSLTWKEWFVQRYWVR
nr:uncharacterized protein LOC106624566 isoform X2 [Bactrocera oleae]